MSGAILAVSFELLLYIFVLVSAYNYVLLRWYVYRRIPYVVALKHRHGACAALLNPSSAEPIVWPAPLKFINELNEDAKTLLEQALMDANREREKNILKGTAYSIPSPSQSDSGLDDSISEVKYQICLSEVKYQICLI